MSLQRLFPRPLQLVRRTEGTQRLGMARMLQGYAAKAPLEIRVFYEMEEARKWLGLED